MAGNWPRIGREPGPICLIARLSAQSEQYLPFASGQLNSSPADGGWSMAGPAFGRPGFMAGLMAGTSHLLPCCARQLACVPVCSRVELPFAAFLCPSKLGPAAVWLPRCVRPRCCGCLWLCPSVGHLARRHKYTKGSRWLQIQFALPQFAACLACAAVCSLLCVCVSGPCAASPACRLASQVRTALRRCHPLDLPSLGLAQVRVDVCAWVACCGRRVLAVQAQMRAVL